jgi:nucleotide-binding universal stress UspA family protein
MQDILYREPGRLISNIKTIVLPVDGSRNAARAATVAFELAEMTGAKLLIVHVIDLGAVQQIAKASGSELLSALQQYVTSGNKLLEGYKSAAADYKLQVELLLERGEPSDKIVHLAKERRADIIVMGSHGLGREDRVHIGGTTDLVVHKAGCAVLIVK